MKLDSDFNAKWEHIIAEVTKTDVPMECLKKVIIKLTGSRQRTINLSLLRQQGLSSEEIEALLTRTFAEYDSQIRDVDFLVDIEAVARIIQPETDNLLKNI
jgi:hypothetical protein